MTPNTGWVCPVSVTDNAAREIRTSFSNDSGCGWKMTMVASESSIWMGHGESSSWAATVTAAGPQR